MVLKCCKIKTPDEQPKGKGEVWFLRACACALHSAHHIFPAAIKYLKSEGALAARSVASVMKVALKCLLIWSLTTCLCRCQRTVCSKLLIALPSWQECGSRGAASLSLVKREEGQAFSLPAPLSANGHRFIYCGSTIKESRCSCDVNYKRF